MLDPIVRIALNIQSGKGVYALLLGSGVSRAAEIPTGWEITLELIRKLAVLKGESCEPDAEGWYKSLTGSDPDYSDILDQVTFSSAERSHLLRSYFEQSDHDREHGRKAPTAAHRAIASLVAKGYIRVIVTTNFDRLLEHALVDQGVQPSVISTPDAVKGATPLIHSPCTVIKVHGDYLDHRLRNTRPELSAYERPFDQLLDRILDEFGLIISGWSAEWDVALRLAIERCSSRRFGTYWTSRGRISGEAEKLILLSRAIVVPVRDADTFFTDIAEKVGALEDLVVGDPLSPRIAIAQMKRYLADPQQRVRLHDLVSGETERVYAEIFSARFPPIQHFTPEVVLRRVREWNQEVAILLPLLACGGYWATDQQITLLCGSVNRLANDPGDRGSRYSGINLDRYPAMLGFYAVGVAAVASGNVGLLKQLLGLKVRVDRYNQNELITEALSADSVLERGQANSLLGGGKGWYTPTSDHVFDILRPVLRDYVPDNGKYDFSFDWFEYLVALVHCDLTVAAKDLDDVQNSTHGGFQAPIGRFLWNHRESDSILKLTKFAPGGPYPEIVTAVLQGGMFGSLGQTLSYERFAILKLGFDRFVYFVRCNRGA